MGWVMLTALAGATMLLLVRLGMARALWSFAGAALMLGATGYALQGRPGISGSPVAARTRVGGADPGLIALRGAIFGRFGRNETSLAAADGLARAGSPIGAVRVMLGAVAEEPGNATLWTWLGMAYVEHDGNTVSPAAQLAFSRAIALAPEHPGPAFFRGMAYVRAGEFAKARPWWARALALTPPEVSYRGEIAMRLMLLDRFLAVQGRDTR
jgi:cytochrome c-type biogenesis protein CcmH